MKRINKYLLLTLLALAIALSFSACDHGVKGTPLEVPANLKVDNLTVTWGEVENANGYEVDIDGKVEGVTVNSYDLSALTAPKTYQIKVRAKGNGKEFKDSAWSGATTYTIEEPTAELAYTLIDDGSAYEVSKGTYLGENKNVVIAAKFNGKPVTRIASNAFYGSSLISVQIPSTVKTIGEAAFRDCAGLKSVILPSGVTTIERGAFYNCPALKNIEIPASVDKIGISAFEETAWFNGKRDGVVYAGKVLYTYKGTMPELTTVIDIPSDVVAIADQAFASRTNLIRINFPGSITSIGYGAFYKSGLININVPESVTHIGGLAFDGTKWYNSQPDGLVYINKILYSYKGQMAGDTKIDNIKDDTVAIAGSAFQACAGLLSIEIPDSVKSIGDNAFNGCYTMTSIEIPRGVTEIGTGVFSGCMLSSLTVAPENSVYKSEGNCLIRRADNCLVAGCGASVIPAYVKKIGDKAFSTILNLTKIEIPAGVVSIGAGAFESCVLLSEVSIGGTVINIGDNAFYKCSALTSIAIPASVVNIGANAFSSCGKLSSCTFAPGLVNIGNFAFQNCTGLTAVELPDTLISLSMGAFYGCALKSIILPQSVEIIDAGVFFGCSSLTAIVVPGSVKSIGYLAFYQCASLTSITLPSALTNMGSQVFVDCVSLTIYLEASAIPESWDPTWNESNRPIISGCTLSEDKTYVVSVAKTAESIYKPTGTIINAPFRSQEYEFIGWATGKGSATVSYTADDIKNAPEGTVLYAIWQAKKS